MEADNRRVRVVRLPYLIPRFAAAQVLFPDTVFVRRSARLTVRLLAHELVHVAQLRRMGLFRFWWTYLVLLLRCGYREHPLELDAVVRSAEPDFLAWAREVLAEETQEVAGKALPSGRPVDPN